MKRLAALLLLAALPTLAEKGDHGKKGPMEAPDPKEMAAKRADHLEGALGLNAEQKAKVKAILEAEMTEMQALHKRLEELRRGNHEKIRALLNDEQKEKFDTMRAKRRLMRHHMKEKLIERRMRHKEPAGPGDEDEEHDDD